MSKPDFVDCPEDEWKLVAENVITGKVWRASNGPSVYLHTYRDTGDENVPTLKIEGMPIFVQEEQDLEPISAQSAIDVYIWPVGAEGRVRVDI